MYWCDCCWLTNTTLLSRLCELFSFKWMPLLLLWSDSCTWHGLLLLKQILLWKKQDSAIVTVLLTLEQYAATAASGSYNSSSKQITTTPNILQQCPRLSRRNYRSATVVSIAPRKKTFSCQTPFQILSVCYQSVKPKFNRMQVVTSHHRRYTVTVMSVGNFFWDFENKICTSTTRLFPETPLNAFG